MLVLPIKKQWYDMILSGIKKEEYRDIKPYYTKRFEKIGLIGAEACSSVKVKFRNGYSATSPSFIAECSCRMGRGNPEWGAVPGVDYYILEIRAIET